MTYSIQYLIRNFDFNPEHGNIKLIEKKEPVTYDMSFRKYIFYQHDRRYWANTFLIY